MVLILGFAIRHKLNNEAILDLLYLIDKIFPQPSSVCKTLYNFKKVIFLFAHTCELLLLLHFWPGQ